MKKFLLKFIIITLPLISLLVTVNYVGDRGSLFQFKYEKEMVDIIGNGQNVTNVGNYSGRVFHKELIASNRVHPNLVVLGSSRTMLINSDLFPDAKMLNNSVGGAVIQDIIINYQLYRTYNPNPKKIIIGIDPWLFNEFETQKSWKYLSNYYNEFMGMKNNRFDDLFRLKQLVSFSYFQQSFSRFSKVLNGKKVPPKATKSKYNSWPTILTDGSLVYNEGERNASPTDVERKIKRFLEGGIYGLDFFSELSEKKISDFESLVTDMQKNGIEIEFILMPYPPLVCEQIHKEYPIVLKVEQFVQDFAKSRNIKVRGSYSPFRLHMDNSYFIDGMHCNELGVKKVIESGYNLDI